MTNRFLQSRGAAGAIPRVVIERSIDGGPQLAGGVEKRRNFNSGHAISLDSASLRNLANSKTGFSPCLLCRRRSVLPP